MLVFDEVTPSVWKRNALSSYTSTYVGSVHERMVRHLMITFSQRFAYAYTNFFELVVEIIRSYV